MQTCTYSQSVHGDVHPGIRHEKYSLLKLKQKGHVPCSDTRAISPSSYASFLHDKIDRNHAIDQAAREQKNTSSTVFHTAASNHGQTSPDTLIPDPKQQSVPTAPQRLRIRRRSTRQETVELLSVLDDLLHRPSRHARKAPSAETISRIAYYRGGWGRMTDLNFLECCIN
jgi:hypothetical protein